MAFIGWYRWDSARNRDFEFGYFGDYNRIRHHLAAMPGVTITREWANHDVTLEEFGFDVTTGAGQTIPIDFQETDPVRNLSGEVLTRTLMTKIQSKASAPNLQN